MTIKKYTIHVHMLEYMYRLIEATVDGKQFGGKLQLVYMRQIIDNVGCWSYAKVKQLAQNGGGQKTTSNQLKR